MSPMISRDRRRLPADTAANDIGMLSQSLQQRLRHAERLRQQMARSIGAAEVDALENFGLGFFAETLQPRNFSRQAGGFQLGD